jgi:hypothetical protein
MKMPTTQLTIMATAIFCGFLASCGPAPVSSFVADVIRTPFVALGAATSAVRSAPAAVTSTAASLNQTANDIGPAAVKLENTAYNRANIGYTKAASN